MKSRYRRGYKVQLSLLPETEELIGQAGWMLIFKAKENEQPVCAIGTLDEVYEQLAQCRELNSSFLWATIYTPRGSIHRSFGCRKGSL